MKFLKFIAGAFLDEWGDVSCIRLVSLFVCMVVLGVWVLFMFIEGRYIPLGYAEAGLIAGAVGAKALQSRFELGGQNLKSFSGDSNV